MADIAVNVRTASGKSFTINVDASSTIKQVREHLVEPSGIPAEQQRLVYAGRILQPTDTLTSIGFKSGNTLHLVKSTLASSQPAASQPSTPAAAAPPRASPAGTAPAAGGAPQMPFPNFAMGAGAPDFAAMQQQVRAAATCALTVQLMANPELMQQMMSSPFVQQMASNPEIMRSMIESNPAMQDLIRRNPEVGHVLNDPELLRQSLEAARNPALHAEMLRQHDRALSNVESMPGGFNLLSRMYSDVQQPMMEAAASQMQSMAGAAPPAPAANPFASLLNPSTPPRRTVADRAAAPNTQPLPSPWAPATPSAGTSAPGAGAGAGAGAGTGAMPGAGGLPFGAGMFGGSGMAGLPGMGAPTPAMMQQMQTMLQDPGFQATMRQLAANPEQMRMMMASNPMMADPNVRAQMEPILQNPALMQQLFDPATMQAMLQLQGVFGGLPGAGAGAGVGAAPGAVPPRTGAPAAPFASPFMSPFGFMPPAGAPAQPAQPPAERFAVQLQQLRDMGFYDEAENIRVLQATNGNVSAAIERLLQS